MKIPMWNLFATCKSFEWMLDLKCLILCIDESIVTLNINRKYHGPHYDLRYNDIDYYENGNCVFTENVM